MLAGVATLFDSKGKRKAETKGFLGEKREEGRQIRIGEANLLEPRPKLTEATSVVGTSTSASTLTEAAPSVVKQLLY